MAIDCNTKAGAPTLGFADLQGVPVRLGTSVATRVTSTQHPNRLTGFWQKRHCSWSFNKKGGAALSRTSFNLDSATFQPSLALNLFCTTSFMAIIHDFTTLPTWEIPWGKQEGALEGLSAPGPGGISCYAGYDAENGGAIATLKSAET